MATNTLLLVFNHTINLTTDKGPLATLGKNISACNRHHVSPVNGKGELVTRGRRLRWVVRKQTRRVEMEKGEGEAAGVFNLLIQFLPMPVTLPLCQEGKWSMQPKTLRPNQIFSQILSLSCISISIAHTISHSPPFFISPCFIFLCFCSSLTDWFLLYSTHVSKKLNFGHKCKQQCLEFLRL